MWYVNEFGTNEYQVLNTDSDMNYILTSSVGALTLAHWLNDGKDVGEAFELANKATQHSVKRG